MTSWHKGPLLAFDTETTGPDPEEARVVTATCAWITPGQPPAIETWLIDPGCEIPEGATAVHGITTAKAQAEGQSPADALFTIAARVGTAIAQGIPLVAFNACFDLTVLDRELARHGMHLDLSEVLVVDPFVLDKHVDPYRKGRRTLTAVCEHYRIQLDGAHDATADALAAARVAWRLAETYLALQVPLEDLHAAQATWRAEQCASLAEYFTRQGNPQDVRGEWPLLPRTREEVPA
ncbi:exonuclease domain-containing protein [Georgenia faecalis]|uniref:exonuclease domain-containing protein n=1 Tax=Georgenia faecalis TaxID=2483799 RepID=UPI000FD86E98|nr:exonuclease domain-containing protein [Georgenia faecalis]